MSNKVCEELIRGSNVEYEVPGIGDLFGKLWKGKACTSSNIQLIAITTTVNLISIKLCLITK